MPKNEDLFEQPAAECEGVAEEAADAAQPCCSVEELARLCKEKICPACTVQKEADDVRLRAMAEMDNFKKRLSREHEEQMRFAAEKILGDLLPTLDNLDLALQYGSRNDACRDMLMGVEMTRKLMLDALMKHGLEPVGAEGEAFTPELHEALGVDCREGFENDSVSRVMQRGYKLKDRLLRPAKVMIHKA
ncbi:MAG: nucleotide exchange factor GrpE [Desulfovibrionaceae bacterium]